MMQSVDDKQIKPLVPKVWPLTTVEVMVVVSQMLMRLMRLEARILVVCPG